MRGFPDQSILCCLSLLFITQMTIGWTSTAQSRRPLTTIGPVTLGGNVGFFTEAYRASGINNRRPGSSGTFYGNTTANSGDVKYELDFLLSTENTRIRQSQNRFAFTTTYGALRGSVGYLNPTFNRFGLNGSTIRGGSLEYKPKHLLFSILAGQSQRAIDAGLNATIRRPTFQRNMVAARIGVGRAENSHLHVTSLIARDKTSSLPSETNASPAENVSVTPQFGLTLLGNRLVLKGEVTASAFSSDTRALQTDSDVTPTLFGLFTPRVGSRFDYASAFSMQYTQLTFKESAEAIVDRFTLLTSYERVNPGFVSLGRPFTRNDQAVFRLRPQMGLFNNKALVSMDISSRRNNLNDTRNATLTHNQFNLATQAQLSPSLFVNAAYLRLSSNNDPVIDSQATAFLEQRYVTQSLLLSPVLTTQLNGLTHRFSLMTSFQSLKDKTSSDFEASAASFNFTNSSITLSHAVILASGLAINSNINRINSNSTTSDVKATSVQLGFNYAFFDRKLSTGLTGGISRTVFGFTPFSPDDAEETLDEDRTTQLTFTLNSTYRVTSRDMVRLVIRGLSTTQSLGGNFNEIQSTLRFEHRF